jgi:nicotinate-nucleotide adenylyltransferase
METMAQRIGILGGTFDPVHYGHLAVAEEARARVPLDIVYMMPARVQPLRQQEQTSSPEHRAAMLERAILSNPNFTLSRIEFERPGLSYTVETMSALRERHPKHSEFFFVLGMDALADLPKWKEPEQLITLCRLVAIRRPGCDLDPRNLFLQLPLLRDRLIILEGPRLDISSTALRQRVRQGLPIRYQVPDAVAEYIYSHHLYVET